MRSAVITSGEHWLTINGIEYLRGTIETIERLTYVQDEQEAVKISGSSVNQSVILVEGTTIDGVEVTSQDELVDFIKQYSFKNGGGSGEGATWGSITGDINDQSDLLDLIQQSGGGASVVSFEETAIGGDGEVITHDTGDSSIQDVILVPRNSFAMDQGEPRYSVSNGVISITTMMTYAGDVLQYSYVAGSASGSGSVNRGFIYKDTMEDFRNMSESEIKSIVDGQVKGVTLLGYYEKGDTPAEINYYISESDLEDDAGSVILINSVKFESKPESMVYFGARAGELFDNLPILKKYVQYLNRVKKNLFFDQDYFFKGDSSIINFFENVEFVNSPNLTFDLTDGDFRFRLVPYADEIIDTDNSSADVVSRIMSDFNRVVNQKNNTVINNDLLSSFVISEVKQGFRNESTVETNRLGGNIQTFYFSEMFSVDSTKNTYANIYNPSIPMSVGGQNVNRVLALKSKRNRFIKGSAYLDFFGSNPSTSYRNIGFGSFRCNNVYIGGFDADLSKVENRLGGFITLDTGQVGIVKEINFIPPNHLAVSPDSSYCMSFSRFRDVDVDKVKSDVNNANIWGVFVSHFVSNLNVTRSNINRVDSHYRGFNYNIDLCNIGSGAVNFCGGGYGNITNSSVYNTDKIAALRADYASEFDGVITIKNVVLFPNSSSNCRVLVCSVVNDSSYNFKLHPNWLEGHIIPMGRKVVIDNVTIDTKLVSGSDNRLARHQIFRYDASGVYQNVSLPDIDIDGVSIINRNPIDKNSTQLNPISFYTYSAFMGIKQGNNGNNVTESSASVKPNFNPIYNCRVNLKNVIINGQVINFNNADLNAGTYTQVFNNSDNKGGCPMFKTVMYNCERGTTITQAYRSHFEMDRGSCFPDFAAVRSGFASYNTRNITGAGLIINPDIAMGSLFDTVDNYDNAVVLNNCYIDCDDLDASNINNRLFVFLFGTGGGSAQYVPTPINLLSIRYNINNVYLTRKTENYLSQMNAALSSAGHKNIDLAFTKLVLSGITNLSNLLVTNVNQLPIYRGNFPARGILRATGVFREYVYNGGNQQWQLLIDSSVNPV